MDCRMTNEEFQEALSNLSFHHAPDGYWDEVNEKRKKHKFVGRKAVVDGKVFECIKAEDDLVFFRLGNGSELIISGDDVADIKWLKR